MPFCRLKNRNITKILPIFAKNRISAAYRNPSIYKARAPLSRGISCENYAEMGKLLRLSSVIHGLYVDELYAFFKGGGERK